MVRNWQKTNNTGIWGGDWNVYTYDALNRLVREKEMDTGLTITYGYDSLGNKTLEQDSRDNLRYTYNALGQRVNSTIMGPDKTKYDRDYTIDYTSPDYHDIAEYNTGHYQWQGTKKVHDLTYLYTADGQRLQVDATRYNQWSPEAVTYKLNVHEDILGSGTWYTRQESGYNANHHDYTTWGNNTKAPTYNYDPEYRATEPYYTGHPYDGSLNIYYAKNRFYDAETGSWLSPDPAKDGLNWYQYCGSNPVTYVDPLGLFRTAGAADALEGLPSDRNSVGAARVLEGEPGRTQRTSQSGNMPSYFNPLSGSKELLAVKGTNNKKESSLGYSWGKEGLPSSEFITTEFINKVIDISKDLQINPDDLMAVMAWESWFNPAKKNPNSTATGLIQFMQSTAIGLNTTVDELAKMSGVEQLDYVYKYYEPYTGKLDDVKDVYMVTLYPAAVGKSDNYVLFEVGDKTYEVNKGLDYNNDGKVTKEEASQCVIERRELFK